MSSHKWTTTREILEHHAAVCASIIGDPTRLVAAALSYCATLSASQERLPTTEVSLRKYHFDPCFLWAPRAARAAAIAWARSAFIVQLAANIEPFEVLSDDCAGDILEFIEITVTRKAAQLVVTHCSSPAARAWSQSIIAAADVEKATADLVPAAREGDLVTVKDCLSKYAKIDIEMDGVTALMMASFGGHTATVQVLVDASADTEAKDKYGFTALICASQKGHTATVQILLDAGANKEAKDNDGFAVLMRASAGGRTATVEVLVAAGSDKDSKSKNGRIALIWASHCGHTAIVQVLLGAGADTDAKNINGNTALMMASRMGETETVMLLLEAGSSKQARNNDGKTALDIAIEESESTVVALLEK